MKTICFLLGVGMLLTGCVAVHRQVGKQDAGIMPTVVFHATPAASILSCLQETASLRSREFNKYFHEIESGLNNGRDEDTLRFICLSLHTKASYRQFKE
ncbi:MAG: hypothetical protein GXO58_02710, partial [Thermodesulfobacteria bacterium]|nr:hypothetical protein [Thermodesulfobacteriota bacterium]